MDAVKAEYTFREIYGWMTNIRMSTFSDGTDDTALIVQELIEEYFRETKKDISESVEEGARALESHYNNQEAINSMGKILSSLFLSLDGTAQTALSHITHYSKRLVLLEEMGFNKSAIYNELLNGHRKILSEVYSSIKRTTMQKMLDVCEYGKIAVYSEVIDLIAEVDERLHIITKEAI